MAVLCVGAAAHAGSKGVVRFVLETGAPETSIDGQGLATVRLPGVGVSALPGQPALPSRTVRVAVPPDAVASTIKLRVTALDERPMPGAFDVRPAPPMALIGKGGVLWGPNAARIENGRDLGVYGRSAIFPATHGSGSPSLGGLRRYRFATVTLNPVRWDPIARTLFHASRLAVEVTFARGKAWQGADAGDCGGDRLARKLLANYGEARSWYAPRCALPEDPKGLAIVTTDEIVATSTLLGGAAESYIGSYAEMRESQGYTVHFATESDWDKPTGEILDARADRIRAWLRKNYETLGLGWVLLVGNPDPSGTSVNAIPMKPCGVDAAQGLDQGPTDFYYADLSGSWDADRNGQVCVWSWDNKDWYGDGVVDFVPEVYVGRIPTYSDGAAAVDEILSRIMAYEQESATGDVSWRRRLMLPDSIYFYEGEPSETGLPSPRWDGATVGEWFIRAQARPRGMQWTTLYEREGVAPSKFESDFAINDRNVVNEWNRGYGLVFWAGHGSEIGVYRTVWAEDADGDGVPDVSQNNYELDSPDFMSTGLLGMVDQAPPPFVVHGSCSNGTPETADNLGYNMLRYGAIGTVSASRAAATWHWPTKDPERWDKPETWDGDVVDIVSDYAVNLIDGQEVGRALDESIAKTTDGQGATSWYQKSIQNLYGDPLVRMVMCRESADCDNGFECDGEESCDNGSCRAGEPVVCQPAGGCDDMACVEGAGCVPGPSCPVADAGADGGGETAGELSAGSGCSVAPSSSRRASLLRTLLSGLI
ncbi:MAG: C25 family cysteine peptidase [Deltaproteobacteria bacterium]|nr:C25 family cysteine peptidase [Deltaproteobacteria bacterium]